MSNLKYWLWLTQRHGLRAQEPFRLLEHFGTPEAVYFAENGEYDQIDLTPQGREALRDKSLEGAEQILAECDRLGLYILTIQDAQYPERLRQIDDPPCVLYGKGKLFRFDEELAIGVVGSRSPTPYGIRMAGKLGLDLARRGAMVVSGMAQGLDAAALKGALSGGGKVVSVLAGGVDVIYPPQNKELYEDIASVGAILSENPPGTPPEGWRFPVRNRIISGLSVGVAAVEAGEISGTLITTRLALEQNREVFAFPGAADAPMSRGTNRLIQRGEAKLILSADDILEEFRDLYPHRLRDPEPLTAQEEEERLAPSQEVPTGKSTRPKKEKTVSPPVDGEEKRAYITLKDDTEGWTDDERAVLTALQSGGGCPDDLVERTQIPARRVLSALTLLQLRGCAEERAGKRFVSTVVLRDI